MQNRMLFFAIITLFAVASQAVSSQQSSGGSNAAAVPQPAPKHYYKLLFVLRESDEGNVLNQRTFGMDISAEPPHTGAAPDWWNMRSGTRFPINGPKETLSYVDVGVNLDVRAEEAADALQMQITSEISSVGSDSSNNSSPQAIRQLKVKSAVLAPVGKSTVVFTADDASSQHRFELEVTPTRAK
jgi:hypothetical protein